MKLHQIKLEHSAVQDRLLMRIATDDGQEILLWLTRRCVKLLWPALMGLAQKSPNIAMHSHPDARSALLGMRHEEAVRKTDYSRPYDEAQREHLLGPEPLLVARIQTRLEGSGQFILTLLPAQGQGINVALDEVLLHLLSGLLLKVVKGAEWELELHLPTGLAAGAEPPPPARLN